MALWAEPPTGVDFWPCRRRQGSCFSDQVAQIKNGHKQMVQSVAAQLLFNALKQKKRLNSADLCDISPLCCGRRARTAEYLHLKTTEGKSCSRYFTVRATKRRSLKPNYFITANSFKRRTIMNQSESSSTDAEGENTQTRARCDAPATAVSDIPGLQMNVWRRHVLVTARPPYKVYAA